MILIVKGTREQAEAAATARRIPFTFGGVYDHGEVQLVAPADQRAKAIKWFCESGPMPQDGFPAGTLLWHN